MCLWLGPGPTEVSGSDLLPWQLLPATVENYISNVFFWKQLFLVLVLKSSEIRKILTASYREYICIYMYVCIYVCVWNCSIKSTN